MAILANSLQLSSRGPPGKGPNFTPILLIFLFPRMAEEYFVNFLCKRKTDRLEAKQLGLRKNMNKTKWMIKNQKANDDCIHKDDTPKMINNALLIYSLLLAKRWMVLFTVLLGVIYSTHQSPTHRCPICFFHDYLASEFFNYGTGRWVPEVSCPLTPGGHLTECGFK